MFAGSFFSAWYFAATYGLSTGGGGPVEPFVPAPSRTVLVPRGDRRVIVVEPEA